MNFKRRLCILPLLCLSVMVGLSSLPAAEPPIRDRAFDVLILRNGMRLLGVVRHPLNSESYTILLRHKWLNRHYPELIDRLDAQENPDERLSVPAAAAVELREHRDAIPADGPAARERRGFLQEQIERLQNLSQKAPEFVSLQIPVKLVRREFLQSASRRRAAYIAILNRIPNPERMNADALSRHLESLSPETAVTEIPVEKAADVPLAERILIHTDRVFGNVSRIIRHGTTYISDNGADGNVAAIAAKLLGQHVQQQLQQVLSAGPNLTGKTAVQEPLSKIGSPPDDEVVRIADRERADIAEVTSMTLDAVKGEAVVVIDVYHRRGDRPWTLALQVRGNATKSDVREEQLARIRNDPQVRQVFDLIGNIGIGATADLSSALTVGAVVEVAQKRAGNRLTQLLSPGSQSFAIMREYRLSELPR